MSQLTRCPNCATTFRVSEAQLQLRGGRVRCGHCSFAFNARACLVDADPITIIDIGTQHTLTEDELRHDGSGPTQRKTLADLEPTKPIPDQVAQGLAETSAWLNELEELPPPTWLKKPSENDTALVTEFAGGEPEKHETPTEAIPVGTPEAEVEDEPPPVADKKPVYKSSTPFAHSDFVPPSKIRARPSRTDNRSSKKARRQRSARVEDKVRKDDSWLKPTGLSPWRWAWRLVYLALGLSALAMAALICRQALVQHYPASRPLLAQACAQIGCRVQPPSHADLLVLDGVEFSFDPERPDVLELNAVLRNGAAYAQAWPLLDVQLLDAQGNRVARRFVPPKSYLPATERLWKEFPAETEIQLAIRMQLSGLAVENYRVMVFYP